MSWGAVLFGALGVILLGGVGLCAYESWALATGNTSISSLVASTFKNSPHTYIIGIFIAGVVLGSLITHFTNWHTNV